MVEETLVMLYSSKKYWLLFFKIYLHWERAHAGEWGEGQRARTFQTDSPLSEEPDPGLNPPTHEIITWAETKSQPSTDSATQGPLTFCFNKPLSWLRLNLYTLVTLKANSSWNLCSVLSALDGLLSWPYARYSSTLARDVSRINVRNLRLFLEALFFPGLSPWFQAALVTLNSVLLFFKPVNLIWVLEEMSNLARQTRQGDVGVCFTRSWPSCKLL